MPTNTGPGTIPGADGAFERFLTAAIATIITIVFSWRLLLEVNEEENVSEFNIPIQTRTALMLQELSNEAGNEKECDSSSDESDNEGEACVERGVFVPVGVSLAERKIMDLELDSLKIESDDESYEKNSDTDDTGSNKSVCSQESEQNTWRDYSWENDMYDSSFHTRRTFRDFVSKDDSSIPDKSYNLLTQSDFLGTPSHSETRQPTSSPDVVLQVYKGEANEQLKNIYTQSTSFSSVKREGEDIEYEVEIVDSDEELYYTSVLEPIMEEDSDDLPSSSSEDDSDEGETSHNSDLLSANISDVNKVDDVQLSGEDSFAPDTARGLCKVNVGDSIEPPPLFRDEPTNECGIIQNISALSSPTCPNNTDNSDISPSRSAAGNKANSVSSALDEDKSVPNDLKIHPSSPPESVISSPGSSLPSSPIRTYAICDGADDSFSDDSCSSASVITVVSVKSSNDDVDTKHQTSISIEQERRLFQTGISHTYEDIYDKTKNVHIPSVHSDRYEQIPSHPNMAGPSTMTQNDTGENSPEVNGISKDTPTSDRKFQFYPGRTRAIDFSNCPDQPREITSSDEDDLYLLDQESDDDSFYLLIGEEGNLRNFDTFANLNACGLSPSEFSDADSSSAVDDAGQQFIFSRVEDIDTDFRKREYVTDRLHTTEVSGPTTVPCDERNDSGELVKLEIVELSDRSSSSLSDPGVSDDSYEQRESTLNRSSEVKPLHNRFSEIEQDINNTGSALYSTLDSNQNISKGDIADLDVGNNNIVLDVQGNAVDTVTLPNNEYRSVQINYQTNDTNKSKSLSGTPGSQEPFVSVDPETTQTLPNTTDTHNQQLDRSVDLDCPTAYTTTTLDSNYSNILDSNLITPKSYIIDTRTPGDLTTALCGPPSDLYSSPEESDSGVLLDNHSDEEQSFEGSENDVSMRGKKNVHFALDPSMIIYDEDEEITRQFEEEKGTPNVRASRISSDPSDQMRDVTLRAKLQDKTNRTRPFSADCSQARIPIDFSRYKIDRKPDYNSEEFSDADLNTADILKPVEECLTSSMQYGKQFSPGRSTTKSVYPNETGVNTISVGKVIRTPAHLPSHLRTHGNHRVAVRSSRSRLPYRSILQQQVPPVKQQHVLYRIPDKVLPVSRQRIIATRRKFLSEENLSDVNDSFGDKFQEHKHSLIHNTPSRTLSHSSEFLDTETFTSVPKSSNIRHISDLYSLRHTECDSQPMPADISHLHKDCIFSPQKREEILNTTLSIENLHEQLSNGDSFSSLLETDIDSGSSSMNATMLSETELDHFMLQFPLQRAYSMNDLGTLRTSSKKTGKYRFADRRRYPKSQSLQTLETDLDEVFANEIEGELIRTPSVHELRITRSLQKLNVPDWYKRSSVSRSGSTQSLFARRDSTSTVSSYGFAPSLTSSPCPSVTPGSTTVVIKTRVTPSNVRLLRAPKLPPTPEKSPSKPIPPSSTPTIRLPSDKYRKTQKKKDLMPIPIVPFSKLRELFEAKSSKLKAAMSPPLSPKSHEKSQAKQTSPIQTRAHERDSIVKPQNEVKPILKTETVIDSNHVDSESKLIEKKDGESVNQSELPKKPKVNKVSFADSPGKRELSSSPRRLGVAKKRRYSLTEDAAASPHPSREGESDDRAGYSYPILSVRQHSPRSSKQSRPSIQVVYASTCIDEEKCNIEMDDVTVEDVLDDLRTVRDQQLHNADNPPVRTTINNDIASTAFNKVCNCTELSDLTYQDEIYLREDKGNDVIVSCENPACRKRVELREAKHHYKTCHGCYTHYCGRACRQEDWIAHKHICVLSRYNTACKHIIKLVNQNPDIRYQFSRIARRGYLTKGRGCLTLYFSDINFANDFLSENNLISKLEDFLPSFLSVPEIDQSCMMREYSENLILMCNGYNPEIKYVLSVAITTPSTFPAKPFPRHTNSIVEKHARLRLGFSSIHPETNGSGNLTTLILTAVSGRQGIRNTIRKKSREICFINIQRKLRDHGVNLRHQYPDVYSCLIDYVQDNKPFAAWIIYPVDGKTRRRFMCVIVPDMEPHVEWTNDPNLMSQLDINEEDDFRLVTNWPVLSNQGTLV
ncbi:hypothetical protein ScPMuIL_011573 [Solemya velum]